MEWVSPRRAAAVGWIFATGLASLAASCAGSDLDWNPAYVGRADASGASSISLGPFFDDRVAPGERETALHPLWRRVRTPESTELQIVDPLLLLRRTDELTEARFLALWWYRNYHPSHQEPERDTMLFPFWFSGSGPPGDNYMALFPLLGTVRDFAGFDSLSFFLFPLYYQVTKDIREREVFHNVTPLIGWTSGGPRGGSWRVLPLFGHWQSEGKYDRWSWLWPIFHYQRNRLDTEHPSTSWSVWPLFQRERGEGLSRWAFLWPFFRFHRATGRDPDTGEWGHEYYRDDVLWPLYRNEHETDHDRLRLFPFFSRYRSPELDSDAYAIPLLWKRQERQAEFVKDTFRFVPFLHWEEKTWRDGRGTDEKLRVWPLFAWKGAGDGGRRLDVPALLPLDVPRFTADFEANWGPLFQLYHTDRDAAGTVRRSALFRLFRQESGPAGSRWSVPLLYAGRHRDGRTTHDLLWGLIRVQTGRGGLGLRLLFLPLLRPDEDAP